MALVYLTTGRLASTRPDAAADACGAALPGQSILERGDVQTLLASKALAELYFGT